MYVVQTTLVGKKRFIIFLFFCPIWIQSLTIWTIIKPVCLKAWYLRIISATISSLYATLTALNTDWPDACYVIDSLLSALSKFLSVVLTQSRSLDVITRRWCVICLIVFTDNYLRTRHDIYSTWNSLHFRYTIIILWIVVLIQQYICHHFSHFRFMLPIHYMKLSFFLSFFLFSFNQMCVSRWIFFYLRIFYFLSLCFLW